MSMSRKVGKRAFQKHFVYVSVLEGGLRGALGVDGGWLPLPILSQQYCDPVSLVLFCELTAPTKMVKSPQIWPLPTPMQLG